MAGSTSSPRLYLAGLGAVMAILIAVTAVVGWVSWSGRRLRRRIRLALADSRKPHA